MSRKRKPRVQKQPFRLGGLSKLSIIVVLGLLLALLYVVAPKAPTQRALNIKNDGTTQQPHEGLRITEVMSVNATALPDKEGNFTDWLEVTNTTAETMSIGGVTLSNRSDKAKFIFPAMDLAAGQRVIVHCDNTNANDAGRPLHAKFKLASIGCSVFMFDTNGFVLDQVTVPTLNADESFSLMADGQFAKVETYSPGFENTPEGHRAYLAQYAVPDRSIIINEVMPAARSGLRDEDGELSDWIELYNQSDKTVSLANLALSDNPQRAIKWTFPSDAAIAPKGYYIVFCSGKNRPLYEAGSDQERISAGAYPHTNFSLAAEGETITLSTLSGQLVDRVTYELVPADQSYGLDPTTGKWRIFTLATPGAANDAQGEAIADRFLRSLNHTGLYISEAMASNTKTELGSKLPFCDWVEVYNSSQQVIDLTGYGLSDNINWPRKWRFPKGTAIWPGEYRVLLLDKSPTPGTNAAALRVSYALKKAGGEVVTLSDPTGRILDRLVLPPLPPDVSYGRTSGQDGFFYYQPATPGEANSVGFAGFSAAPKFSVPGGMYEKNVNLTIQAPAGTVRYTTNGAIPTIDNSTEYTGPLEIKDSTVIRARSFVPGLEPSETITATYILKSYYTMPVVCLTTDPDELWNNETGMLALGEGVDLTKYTKLPFKNPTPVYRSHGKIQRPGYAEMFLQDGADALFSQACTFGLIGQFSLDIPQKSMKVTARAPLGNRYFDARLFEDRPFDQYKSFVLRASGNDGVWTRMVDGVQSRLVDQLDTHLPHQAWRPVIVYLNGAYWGHYNLRERVSRYFVAQHEGLPLSEADNMDIIEANWKPYYGSAKEYKDLIAKVKTLSPGKHPEDLQYILDHIDVDSYFDWMILEAFFANTDTGNIRAYKLHGDKWKWILFDLDYGLFKSTNQGVAHVLNPKGMGSMKDIDNTLILKLMENADMQDKFLKRFGEIFQKLTSQVMLDQIDECYKLLEPEMALHFERWAEFNLKNISFDQPTTVDGCLRYWNSRVDRLRETVMKRPHYCWQQVKEFFKLSDAQMRGYFGPQPEMPPQFVTTPKPKK